MILQNLICSPFSFYEKQLKQYVPTEGCGATALFQSLRREKDLQIIWWLEKSKIHPNTENLLNTTYNWITEESYIKGQLLKLCSYEV